MEKTLYIAVLFVSTAVLTACSTAQSEPVHIQKTELKVVNEINQTMKHSAFPCLENRGGAALRASSTPFVLSAHSNSLDFIAPAKAVHAPANAAKATTKITKRITGSSKDLSFYAAQTKRVKELKKKRSPRRQPATCL